jgi:hypothetical protein
MLILDATTKSIEIILSAAVATNQLPVVSSYVDTTSSASTPGANTTASNNTTGVTIVAAPAASTQRLVKAIQIYNADTTQASITVRYNDNSTLRTLWTGSIDIGDTLQYMSGMGFRVFDFKGNLKTVDTILVPAPQIMKSVGFDSANLTALTTSTSNTTYAQYLGKIERPYTQMTLRYRVTTAVATITWAEVAIATGTFTIAGGATLTRRGYTDVSGINNSTGQKSVAVTISGVKAGDDVWALYGAQATTMHVHRGGLADDLQCGHYQELAATRPSTMGAATAFGVSGATLVPAWIYAQGRV